MSVTKSWVRRLFPVWRRGAEKQLSDRRDLFRRPRLEPLEDRLCPSGTWATEAPMLTPRVDPGVGVVNGILYAVGGAQNGGIFLATNEAYNPTTNSWQTKAPMQTQRDQCGVGVVNGILYAVGGFNGSETPTVEAYDPASDTWTFKAPLPTGGNDRPVNAVGVVNGILYAVVPSESGVLPMTLDAYNPTNNTWTVVGTVPTAVVAEDAMGVANGILYVVGGNSGTAAVGTVEAYDPATNTWTAKAPMPTPRGHLSVAVVNAILYAVGGDGSSGVVATVEAYDPTTDTWTTETSMPTARTQLGADVVNGVLYVVGGHVSGSGIVATNEAFTPTVTPTVTLTAANATYTGSAYDTANLTSMVTPAAAAGSVSYVFYSDASGQNTIATPINAGTYYVQAFFTSSSSGYTNAESGIVSFTITAKSLTVDATTQGTLNIAKAGTISFALQITAGLVGSNNNVAALFNGAVFTIAVDGTSYSLTATATVGSDGTINLSMRMSQGLQNALLTALSQGKTVDFNLTALSNDSDYSIDADAISRLISQGKLKFAVV